MADVFIELLIRRNPLPGDILKRSLIFSGILVLTLLLAVLSFSFPALTVFVPMMIVGGGWLALIVFKRRIVEFEYIMTNSELDFDKITGRASRKRILSVDSRVFELCAPYTQELYRQYEQGAGRKLDFSSNTDLSKRWLAVFPGDKGRVLLIFEPDERILTQLRMYLRGKMQ